MSERRERKEASPTLPQLTTGRSFLATSQGAGPEAHSLTVSLSSGDQDGIQSGEAARLPGKSIREERGPTICRGSPLIVA